MGTDSEGDFNDLFSDIDLSCSKIDFKLEDIKLDVLGDAYEYMRHAHAPAALGPQI